MTGHRERILDESGGVTRAELFIAERDFLAASVAVWREIDSLSAGPGGYKGLDSSTQLRVCEREAWNRYRRCLDAVARQEDKIATLRELIGQAAAEASGGQLTDGTLAWMIAESERG